jgi:hypothetical protein
MTYPIAQDPAFVLHLDVGVPLETSRSPGATRRFVPILGGTVGGPPPGVVLPGGGDWQTVLVEGSIEIDAHYLLDLDGATIEVRSTGVRTASPDVLSRLAAGEAVAADEYYFRTAIRLTTGSARFAHLNRMLFISTGERPASQVHLSIYPVL